MSAEGSNDQTATAQIQHLRRTMDAVADRAAASDGWVSVSERVRSGDPAPLPAAQPARPIGRLVLAVAAAVVLLAGIAIGTWASTRPEPDSGYTSTNGGPGQTNDERDGEIAQGTFDDGGGWVLRLTTTDHAATTALSVAVGSADDQSGSSADPAATAFKSIETLDSGGRHFASGLLCGGSTVPGRARRRSSKEQGFEPGLGSSRSTRWSSLPSIRMGGNSTAANSRRATPMKAPATGSWGPSTRARNPHRLPDRAVEASWRDTPWLTDTYSRRSAHECCCDPLDDSGRLHRADRLLRRRHPGVDLGPTPAEILIDEWLITGGTCAQAPPELAGRAAPHSIVGWPGPRAGSPVLLRVEATGAIGGGITGRRQG